MLGQGGSSNLAVTGAGGGRYGHTSGGVVHPATGGIITGGTPGRDSVPAMLTPGEIVLNRQQQLALLRGGAGGITLNFAGANFYGAPTSQIAQQWAKAMAPHLNRMQARRA